MKVLIRFLAFHGQLPDTYTEIELPDNSNVDGLLKAAGEMWGERQKGSNENTTRRFAGDVLAASNGRVLQSDEQLSEGQEISIIGQIIGG